MILDVGGQPCGEMEVGRALSECGYFSAALGFTDFWVPRTQRRMEEKVSNANIQAIMEKDRTGRESYRRVWPYMWAREAS